MAARRVLSPRAPAGDTGANETPNKDNTIPTDTVSWLSVGGGHSCAWLPLETLLK